MPQEVDGIPEKSKKTEANKGRANFVYKMYNQMNLSTESELTFSSEFTSSSSTDPSEIRRHTDSELMAPISGPDFQLQEIKDLWGASAC